jgi:hypothetical protein
MTGYHLTIMSFVGSPALRDIQYIPFRLLLRGSSTWPRYGEHPWVLPIKPRLCLHLLVRTRLQQQRYSITVCRPIRAQASANPSRAIPSPFFIPASPIPLRYHEICVSPECIPTIPVLIHAVKLFRQSDLHHHWQCPSLIDHRSTPGHRAREV